MNQLKFEIIPLTVETQPITNDRPGDELIMGCGGSGGLPPCIPDAFCIPAAPPDCLPLITLIW